MNKLLEVGNLQLQFVADSLGCQFEATGNILAINEMSNDESIQTIDSPILYYDCFIVDCGYNTVPIYLPSIISDIMLNTKNFQILDKLAAFEGIVLHPLSNGTNLVNGETIRTDQPFFTPCVGLSLDW